MLRIARSLVVAISVLALGACATTMTVSSHVASDLEFSQYHTWNWGPADTLPTGDPRLDANPFFKDHLAGAVEKGLAARGLGPPTADNPDLLIHYHASINTRIDVNGADTTNGYCDGGGCGEAVSEYEAGTLVLDIVDARSMRVIWRGWAQDRVHGILDSEDQMAKKIDEAARRMLERLPPTR